ARPRRAAHRADQRGRLPPRAVPRRRARPHRGGGPRQGRGRGGDLAGAGGGARGQDHRPHGRAAREPRGRRRGAGPTRPAARRRQAAGAAAAGPRAPRARARPQRRREGPVSREQGAFSAEQVAGLLGLTLAQIRGYVRAGVIDPERGPRGELRFSFQDLVFLRVVKGLATARIPPRRVRQAIRRLRQQLPDGRPLSGVRLAAEGGHIVVRSPDGIWSPDSGQFWLDFDGASRPGVAAGATVPLPAREETPVELTADAEGWYALGCELEESDPARAREAYTR